MSSLENTPLSRDRAELGVLSPEPEVPTCGKISSTALGGRPVRSNCRDRRRSREAIQRPRLGESAPGAINANLSRSVCGASCRGRSSGSGTREVRDRELSFVRREISASTSLICGRRGVISSVRFCSSGLRKRGRGSSPEGVSMRQTSEVRLGRM